MYFYEHTNGEIISKPDLVCETGTTPFEYFDSPFVKRWWHEEGNHRVPKTILATKGEENEKVI